MCSTIDLAIWLTSGFFGYFGLIMDPHFTSAIGFSAFSSSRIVAFRSLFRNHAARVISDSSAALLRGVGQPDPARISPSYPERQIPSMETAATPITRLGHYPAPHFIAQLC